MTFSAIPNPDLTVGEGEVVALVGSNAAGKTTTMRMVITMPPPTPATGATPSA